MRRHNKPCSFKRELNTLAKNIDSCQPAQSAHADMSRNFLLLIIFIDVHETFYNTVTIGCCTKDGSINKSCEWIHKYAMKMDP